MATHWACLWDFGGSDRASLVLTRGSLLCDGWAYFMMYVLPLVITVAGRFFLLCWKYRIPFMYFLGVNAIHLWYMNPVTTREMIAPHIAVIGVVCIAYLFALGDELGKRTNGCGRRR